MSTDDDIYFAPWAVDEVAEWMAGVLELEPLTPPDLDEGEYFYKSRSPLVEGRDVLLLVGPNIHSVADPEPDEVSAIDGYTGMISVRIAGMRSEQEQAREACALFNELAAVRPGVALVLSHALSWIVAAYLPGRGVHGFPPETSLDEDAIDAWQPWIHGE